MEWEPFVHVVHSLNIRTGLIRRPEDQKRVKGDPLKALALFS